MIGYLFRGTVPVPHFLGSNAWLMADWLGCDVRGELEVRSIRTYRVRGNLSVAGAEKVLRQDIEAILCSS